MVVENAIIKTKEIVSLLKDRTKVPGVRLPSNIEFSIQSSILKVCINKPTQNMQTDDAAFEGWIAALKVWLSDIIKHVELDYCCPSDLPANRLSNPEVCHFNRFLYRINNFSRFFPEWFSLSDNKIDQVSEFMLWLKQGHCLLNQLLRERESVFSKTDNQERKIESWFRFHDGQKPLCERWDLDHTKLFNQLPIGLFYQKIAKDQAVFTRGAGAIDLGGMSKDGSTLHIIELKCGKNKSMGVISEVLFYTAILYDTCVAKDTLFEFGRYKNAPQTPEMKMIQNGYKKLHSHILAEYYHPLFSDDVVYLLKEGLSKLDIKFDRAKYDYEKKIMLA